MEHLEIKWDSANTDNFAISKPFVTANLMDSLSVYTFNNHLRELNDFGIHNLARLITQP